MDDRPDAISAGIVKDRPSARARCSSKGESPGRGRADFAEPSPAAAGRPKVKSRLAAQAKGNLKRAIADAAASEADDSEGALRHRTGEQHLPRRTLRHRTAFRLQEGYCRLEALKAR